MDDSIIGAIFALIAIVTYGSTYVPVRWFAAGDGIFFQWLMCVGVFLVGVVVFLFDGCPPVEPICMLSGLFFALGNALTIFIMDGVGMAVGSLLWNTVTCVVGWAISRFGWLGTEKVVPENDLLNIIGVVIVCIGGACFAPIKHHPMKVREAPAQFYKESDEEYDRASVRAASTPKRICALLLTVLVGAMYGNMMTPINYATIHSSSHHAHSHFFSFCVGTLLSATVILVIYSAVKKNRPFVNPELILPSIASGLIYGIATCSLFVANQNLGQVIAYPIIAKSPGIITSLWAVLLFKEIKGRWNTAALISGIAITLTGVTLISISKIHF